MNKYEKAIMAYEQNRQLVKKLSIERAKLLDSCEEIKTLDDFFNKPKCTVAAHLKLEEKIREGGVDDRYSFLEILQEGNDDGEYCDNCTKSYHLKIGPLAEAKALLGIEKRRISALGRGLIKRSRQK